MTSRIPLPIKRQVRQEAGFGCCVCGNPIFQYHHIVRNSQNPEDMMVLCPNHHDEATAKAMTLDEQRQFKENPINIQRGYTEGLLKINQETPVINIGNSVQLITEGDILIVDDESIFSLQVNEGRLELSLKLYDKKDVLHAEIFQNEWITGEHLPWDLEARYQYLLIRRKLRDIQLELDARKTPMNIRADLWRHGSNFVLSPEELYCKHGSGKGGLIFRDLCLVGAVFSFDHENKIYQIKRHPKYGKFHIVSYWPVSKRIREGLDAWKKTSCEHEFKLIIDRKKYRVLKCIKCDTIDKQWKKKDA